MGLLWQSTPLNYLEKIFQIPYTLRPMDSHGFGSLVDALTGAPKRLIPPASESAIAGTTTHAGSAASAPATSTPVESKKIPEMRDGTREKSKRIDRRPEYLRIEDPEKSFMKLLHELIPSPRAGKRFINIYRLLRASVEDRERSAFIGEADGGEHQCVLLLLAILTGYPSEATEILHELIHHEHNETWWVFIENLKAWSLSGATDSAKQVRRSRRDFDGGGGAQPEPSPDIITGVLHARRWDELFNKLGRLRLNVNDEPCTAYAKWAPRIARYSFQSGRVLFNAG